MTTAGVVSEYPVPTAGSNPAGITAGPDGNVWFAEQAASKLGKLTTGGSFTEYTVPTAGSSPQRITTGPDGNLWFTEGGGWCIGCSQPNPGTSGIGKVGKVTTSGSFTEYNIPTSSGDPEMIVAAPAGDSSLWFVEENLSKVAKVSTAGVFTEYAVPTSPTFFGGLTTGPDGNVWFTESLASKVASIAPSSGAVTEYATPTAAAHPQRIAVGADNNLWFTEHDANKIGQLIYGGPIGGTVTPQENSAGSNPAEICVLCSQGQQAKPVDTATGAFWHSFTDFAIPGRGMALSFSRTYSSVFAGTNSPFGYGWSFSYSMSLTQNPSPTSVTIQQENGSLVTFTPSGSA